MDDSPSQSEPANWSGWLKRLPLRVAPWVASAALAALLWRRRGGAPVLEGPSPAPTPEACEAAEPGRGRAADAPWTIPHRGWKDILWRSWHAAGRNRLGFLAGGVTFYLLLAAFPAMAAFVSICGIFLDLNAVAGLIDQISAILPRPAVDLIAGELVRLSAQRHETLSAAFLFGALASLWSANAGMKALFDALNVAYGESEKRPYLHRTLITYVATLGSTAILVAVTLLTLAAPAALRALDLAPLTATLAPARWLVVYVLGAGGLVMVYRHGPSRTMPALRWVICGAAGAALVWMVGSMGFSAYLNAFAHLGATYGSLAALVGSMLWVWFSVMVALSGAQLNAEIEHQTARDTTVGAPRAIGERGAAMADSLGAAFTVSPREARHIVRAFLRRQVSYVVAYLRRLTRR